MSPSHRNSLATTLAAALFAVAPSLAAAQPADDESGNAETTAEEGETGEGEQGEGETKAAEKKPAELPPSSLGDWGTGGEEPEGKYRPTGKTGKLKEKEEEESKENVGPPVLPPPGYAYLDTAIGFGDTRVVVQPTGATAVTPTASFLMAVGYRFGEEGVIWNLGLRFPLSTGIANGPREPLADGLRDPDEYKRIAVGGVELGIKPAFILGKHMRLPLGLAFTAPSATGDMHAGPDDLGDRGVAIVNQAAAASRGFEDRALFAYKRFGITPSIGFIWDEMPFEVDVDTKLELMIRVMGEDPMPNSGVSTRDFAVNWVLRAGFFYNFFDGILAPGLRMWLAVGSMLDYSDSQDYGGAQFVFEPNIKSRIPFTESESVGMTAQVGAILPAGGHLGGADDLGDVSVIGLRVGTGLFF